MVIKMCPLSTFRRATKLKGKSEHSGREFYECEAILDGQKIAQTALQEYVLNQLSKLIKKGLVKEFSKRGPNLIIYMNSKESYSVIGSSSEEGETGFICAM